MTCKISFVNPVHLHVMPVQVIKTPALNVQVGKIEYCKDNNVVVWRPTMNLAVRHVNSATIYVKNAQ